MEPLGDWIDIAPWKSGKVLIINPNTLRSEHTTTGKRAMLDEDPTAVFVVAWGGEWRSSARRFGPGDWPKVRGHLA